MSATFATIVWPQATTRPGVFSRLFNGCHDRIARHFVRRAAIASLRELDDRLLWDIGLTRFQIEAAVDGFIPPSDKARMRSAASAAMGLCAGGRPRASAAEAAQWS
jgi:uncharacterized protein YjiS (DUF1127 family)